MPFAADDQAVVLLSQLVAALLSATDSLDESELQCAILDLCGLTQHRLDGLHVTQLAADLKAARAAAVAAEHHRLDVSVRQRGVAPTADHSTSMNAANTGRSDFAHDENSVHKNHCHVKPGPLMELSTSITPDEWQIATPAPKSQSSSRLGSMSAVTSSKKAPRSRLGSMLKQQQPTPAPASAGPNCKAADDGGLADLMAAKLRLEDRSAACEHSITAEAATPSCLPSTQQPTQIRANAAPLRPKAGRQHRVRFAENNNVADDRPGEDAAHQQDCFVPQSVARHAIRRDNRVMDMPSSAALMDVTDGRPGTAGIPISKGRSQRTRNQTACDASHKLHAAMDVDVDGPDSSSKTSAAVGKGNSRAIMDPCPAGSGDTPNLLPSQCHREGQEQHKHVLGASVKCSAGDSQHISVECSQPSWHSSVVLLLEGGLHQLPWESLPDLQQHAIFR